MFRKLLNNLNNREGQNTLEYVLMLAFVAAIIVLFFSLFRGKFTGLVEKVGGKIESAIKKIK